MGFGVLNVASQELSVLGSNSNIGSGAPITSFECPLPATFENFEILLRTRDIKFGFFPLFYQKTRHI